MKKIVLILLLLTTATFAEFNYSFEDAYPGLLSNSVIEIVYDSTGIWLGTAGGVSYMADGDTLWQTFGMGSGLVSNLVSAVTGNRYNDTSLVAVATLHTEKRNDQSVEFGDGFSLTIDGGLTWDTLQPPQANWVGMLAWDMDVYQDDIYGACWYGGLIRLKDALYNRDDSLWENLYLNASDSIDHYIDSTFYNLTNYYFSVKVDTTLAPDTISVFAGTALGINRFIFTDYNNGQKQDAAWQIEFDPEDENSLPGNHVVALATNGKPGRVYNVYLDGDYAYVAHDLEGLRIVNISAPDSILIEERYCDTPGRAYAVFVDSVGDSLYAFVADYDQGLQIINVSRSNPNSVGSYDTYGLALSVFVDGDYAYIADGYSGLQIIYISDPVTPIHVFNYPTPGIANDVYVDNGYAYIADGSNGMVILDVTDPLNPALAGTFASPGYAKAVFVDSSLAYVADQDSGLYVVDIADPANPSTVAFVRTPGDASGVFYNGQYIFVTDEISMNVYELVTDTTVALLYVGGYETPGTALNVALSGDYAFVADNYFGMQALDVSNIDSISAAGNFAPVCSSYVWAACRIGGGSSGQKYGVAYSHNYGKTWTTAIEHSAWDFAFIGDTVLVATDDGLYLSDDYSNWNVIREFNDSDPSRRRHYFPSGIFAVETVGSDIWVGGADGTVRIAGGDTTIFRSQIRASEHFAYPSPFSPIASTRKGTTIHYVPPKTTAVTIEIYDFNLDLVRTVVDNETRLAGIDVDDDVWDGRNDKGKLVANGVYFYNIKLGTGEDWWGKVAVVK